MPPGQAAEDLAGFGDALLGQAEMPQLEVAPEQRHRRVVRRFRCAHTGMNVVNDW